MPDSPSRSTDLAAQRAAFRRVFPGVMFAMALAAMDQTILAAAIPAIAGALGNFADVSWLASAYLIAATITAPIYGHLGDRFGRRRMLFVALGIFVVASVACSLATSLGMLIIGRALQGLGGGGLMTTAHALISEQVPPRERGRYQGYFAALFAASSTMGPVLGGYLTQHASWRAVFLINVPLGLLAALLARRVPYVEPHRVGKFRPDVLGTLLFATGACVLLFTLSSAGHRIAWTSPNLLGLIAVGIGTFMLLYFWERRFDDPIIPVRILTKTSILRSNLLVMVFGASLFSLVLYLPMFLQLGRGAGVGESGTLLLPVTLTMALAASITGHTITRSGRLTILPIVGLSISTVAFATLAITIHWAPTAMILILVAVGAAGLGSVMPVMQLIVQDEAGRSALGSATASVSVSRSLGGATGSALAGAMLYLMLGGDDPLISNALTRFNEQGSQFLASLSNTEREAITSRLENAFRGVFAMVALVTAIGVALARSIPRRRI